MFCCRKQNFIFVSVPLLGCLGLHPGGLCMDDKQNHCQQTADGCQLCFCRDLRYKGRFSSLDENLFDSFRFVSFLLELMQFYFKQFCCFRPNNGCGEVQTGLVQLEEGFPTLPADKQMRHSVVSLAKTLNGTFPCLVVLASSSKLQ